MAIFKCKMCGEVLNLAEAVNGVCACSVCGSHQTTPRLLSERLEDLYGRANHLRRNNEFDVAMSVYQQILTEAPDDPEAYFGVVLCRYGVEYVKDGASNKRIPTINRTQKKPMSADDDFLLALSLATDEQREVYQAESLVIDNILKDILEISSKEEPFDVFICYKESDEHGGRTLDSAIAQQIYRELERDGIRTFFARVTLEDKVGQKYEPYIYSALQSAKVMIVVGSKKEYINAVWVKNEWSRYLALSAQSKNKTLVPVYKGMSPTEIPEFALIQAQDYDQIGALENLIHEVERLVGKKIAQADPNKELIEKAYFSLDFEEFDTAVSLADKILESDFKCAEAYFIRLLASLKLTDAQALCSYDKPITDNVDFKKAFRFAEGELKEILADAERVTKKNYEKTLSLTPPPVAPTIAKTEPPVVKIETPVIKPEAPKPTTSATAPVKKEAAELTVPAGTPVTEIKIPLPGKIMSIKVKPGQAVKKGNILFTLEAMKMENEVLSPIGGYVLNVNIVPNADYETGYLAMTLSTVKPTAVIMKDVDLNAPFDGKVGYIVATEGQKVGKGTTLLYLNEERICASFDCVVSKIHVGMYDEVSKGQLLFTLNPWNMSGNHHIDDNGVLTFAPGVTWVDGQQFQTKTNIKEVIIHEGITLIDNSVFSGCTAIERVTLPSSLSSLGWRSFGSCTSLKEIRIPRGIKRIPSDAFSDCTSLKHVYLHDELIELAFGAFRNCSSLESISIPLRVTKMEAPFIGCSSLSSVTIAKENPSFVADNIGIYNKDMDTLVQFFGEDLRDLPDTIKTIGTGACMYSDKLLGTLLPDSVTVIGEHAFNSCKGLDSIHLPDSLVRIEKYAFYGCPLKDIVIPESVEYVGEQAISVTDKIYCRKKVGLFNKPKWHKDFNVNKKPVKWGHNSPFSPTLG
ncbi:MAG: leucine-rich repeat protein [Clostridia bacterium]|nr:leucine-rich repeat protein [Clostridia bacterium]